MADPDTLAISSRSSKEIMRAINVAFPQLPGDVARRLNFISLRYWQLYGFDGVYNRVNNRTVTTIPTEFDAPGDDPKPIATGQSGDVRYELFDAPPSNKKSEAAEDERHE